MTNRGYLNRGASLGSRCRHWDEWYIGTKFEPDVAVTVEEWVVQRVSTGSRVAMCPNAANSLFELGSKLHDIHMHKFLQGVHVDKRRKRLLAVTMAGLERWMCVSLDIDRNTAAIWQGVQ